MARSQTKRGAAPAGRGGKRGRRKSAPLVLVTGATGFLGRHITRLFADAGMRVRALVRPSSNLEPIRAWIEETHIGDLTDPDSLEGMCDGVDAVVHAGCAVKGTFDAGMGALDAFLDVNRGGTINVAREVLRHEGLRMVHVSSTAAMGPPATRVVDEGSPCNPQTPYQRSKRAAELALLELHENEGLNVVIIRPCVIAGPGKDVSELLSLLKMTKHGMLPYIGRNLDVQKPMVMVDDVVQATRLAIDAGEPGGIYFVHSGARHTMGEILRVAGELTGSRRTHFHVPVPLARIAASVFETVARVRPNWNPPLTHDRIDLFLADRVIDIARARTELGYAPEHQDMREMLGSTYAYYRQKGLI